MKTILVIGLFALLLFAPGVAASDDPVCEGAGPKNCAVGTVTAILGGCNPLYDYVQECNPEETS